MTLSLRVADQAILDQEEIWRYIADDNVSAADRVIDQIVDSFASLLVMPGSGRARPELAPGLHSYTTSPYLIFYLVSETHLDIVRVLHGGRDLEATFTKIAT